MLKNKLRNFILINIVLIFEYITNFYFILNANHKIYTNNILLKSYKQFLNIDENFGIILQGPVIKKNNFTYNTIKLYKYIYPKINIVLSTWDDLDEITLHKFKSLEIYLLLNKKPNYTGLSNINLQLVSTKNGIDFLRTLNTKYILKTRTDQRINKSINFLLYFKIIQDKFPLNNTIHFEKRIIITSLNTFKSRLYGISDMFVFGLANDLYKYWNIPLETDCRKVMINIDPKYYIQNNIAEGFIVNHFFKLICHEPKWDQEDSVKIFTKYFYIVDKDQLDLFWYKYDRYFNSLILNKSSEIHNWELFENSDWFIFSN